MALTLSLNLIAPVNMKNWNLFFANVMDCLKTHLSPFLFYHHWKHTQHVQKVAEYIAQQENITEDDILLIETAALFHNAGFINGANEGHEEESIRLAKKNCRNLDMPEKKLKLLQV